MNSYQITKLLDNDSLRSNNLKEDDLLLQDIMRNLNDEIKILYKLEDIQIQKKLEDVYEDKTDEFFIHLENLLYIKQSYYIDEIEKDGMEKTIDSNIFNELTLKDVIDIKDIFINEDININSQKFKDALNKKKEEKEKWSKYNIINTISEFINIPKENINLISNLSEYIKFISELEDAVNYVSRGQKDCTYKLVPSLHRKCSEDYSMHQDNYESLFKQKVIYYDSEIKNKSAEELRGEGQHFGLPTNLLDFTEAHLISLLFAIEDYTYTEQHSIVYFVNSCIYNNTCIGISEKLIDYSNQNMVNSTERFSSRSFFIKLGNSNERIHFQKGCFLKIAYEDRKNFQHKLKDCCKILIIDKESKKDILKELFNLGITFENIYPDKDNLVKSINFHQEEMIGENI